MRPAIRLAVVGPAGMLRTGLCALLGERKDISVVDELDSCEPLSEQGRETPDVVLIDMDGHSDAEPAGLDQLMAARPEMRVLMLASARNLRAQVRAVAVGAMGLVFKERSPETLLRAVARVHEGETCFEREVIAAAFRRGARPDDEDALASRFGESELTTREREVTALAAEGLRNKKIAERLFISDVTVRHHLSSIYMKLGVSNRIELMTHALGTKQAVEPAPEAARGSGIQRDERPTRVDMRSVSGVAALRTASGPARR